MSFVRIGDLSLHYRLRLAGEGNDTLVFINSLGTDFRIWDGVADSLRGVASILIYDKRGHGLSDVGSQPCTIEDHVDDLVGLLDHLGLEKVILCGLSVGGLIAQAFHARLPERVQGLVLCGTASRIGTQASWNARIDAIERNGIAALADDILAKWFTPAFHRESAADLAGIRNMLTRQPVAGYVGTCAAIRDADYTAAATRIAVPTLVLVGAADGSTTPELVKAMADAIPGARFEIVRDAAHILCFEQPAAVAAHLRDFLARHFLFD